MDNTLRQILSELVQVSMQLDQARARIAELEAELEAQKGDGPHS